MKTLQFYQHTYLFFLILVLLFLLFGRWMHSHHVKTTGSSSLVSVVPT